MEWKDKMDLVLFQASQKTKLLKFLSFVGCSFCLLVEMCMSICFQLSVVCSTSGLQLVFAHTLLASHVLCKMLGFFFLYCWNYQTGGV